MRTIENMHLYVSKEAVELEHTFNDQTFDNSDKIGLLQPFLTNLYHVEENDTVYTLITYRYLIHFLQYIQIPFTFSYLYCFQCTNYSYYQKHDTRKKSMLSLHISKKKYYNQKQVFLGVTNCVNIPKSAFSKKI